MSDAQVAISPVEFVPNDTSQRTFWVERTVDGDVERVGNISYTPEYGWNVYSPREMFPEAVFTGKHGLTEAQQYVRSHMDTDATMPAPEAVEAPISNKARIKRDAKAKKAAPDVVVEADDPERVEKLEDSAADAVKKPRKPRAPKAEKPSPSALTDSLVQIEKMEKEREKARAEAKAAAPVKKDGPDLSGLVPEAHRDDSYGFTVAVAELTDTDGGDPVQKDFVENIALLGITHPILARANGDGTYALIDGRRRIQAARKLGITRVPAIIEVRDDANDDILALSSNYQRSVNFIDAARRVERQISQREGSQAEREAAVAKAAGMTLPQVRRLRDIATLPEVLIEACETGRMSLWSAGMVSRKSFGEAATKRILDTLRLKGKVTPDDVTDARRARQMEAAASLGADLYEGIETDAMDTDALTGDSEPVGALNEVTEAPSGAVAVATKAPKVDKRTALLLDALAGFRAAEAALERAGRLSDDEQDCLTFAKEAITRLTTV